MKRRRLVAALASAALAIVCWYATVAPDTADDPWPTTLGDQQFWAMVHGFSEPGGAFTPVGGYRSDNADLMAHTDPQGNPCSYLASEDAFRLFRRYQLRNGIVPLVGDFGGRTTLRAVGQYLARHGTIVAAFYTSNVEVYLREEARERFVTNVAALPRDEHSTFIRTRFNTIGHTHDRPDYKTTTVTEPFGEFVDSWPAEAQ